MAHTQADVIQSRVALAKAIHKEISIHQGYIAALRNALSGMNMVAAIEQPVPIAEDDIPAAKGFIKNLSDKISAAGNGA